MKGFGRKKESFSRRFCFGKFQWAVLFAACFFVFSPNIIANESEDASSSDLERVVLQLKWYHQFQSAGYYAAVEKGYYRDAGLDVKLLEGGPFDTVDEVLSSRADYGVSTVGILLRRFRGAPLVVLAAIFQHSPDVLMARKDSEIHDPQDLVGRRVWMTKEIRAAELHAMFLSEGVPLEKIHTLADTMPQVDYFDQSIDAFSVYTTNEPFLLEQRNIPVSFIVPRTYGIDFYGDCLYTTEKELKEHPNRVKRFREASLKGWEYAMQNPEEIIDVIITKYGSKMTREHLQYEAREMRDLVMPDLVQMGHMNLGRWRHIADTYAKLGMAEPDYSLEGFIYDPNPKPDHTRLYWLMGIVASLLMLSALAAFILWFFNRRLRTTAQRRTMELEESNEMLRNSEAIYKELADSISDVFFAVDKDLKYIYWNKASEELTGIPVEDAIGKSIYELFPEVRGTKIENTYLNALAEHRAFSVVDEYQLRGVDFFFEINAYPSMNGLSIFAKDITERKRMEEELLKARKIESVGVLAGGIAHDFNNLLTGIIGNISLAEMYAESGRPAAKILERLREADKASMRAKDLTQKLLTFASGGAPIRQTSSIAKLLRDSATLALSGSNIRCEFSIPDDLWWVEMDEGQMNQVISNIIINADQAMKGGGIIKVNARNVVVEKEHGLPLEDGKYVQISIEDHGIGISEANLPKIFDPYFTANQTGSGLGLAICYSIVKKHGGYITAESQIGIGTAIHIHLPASSKEVSIEKESRKTKAIMGMGRILVMDDEEIVRELARNVLINLGYEVTVAVDGTEAVKLYKEAMESHDPFDAAIIDLTIPGGMGGRETIRNLMAIDPEVKAIVSSGYSNDPIMTDFREYGFKGVIAKPYEAVELSEALSKVMRDTTA